MNKIALALIMWVPLAGCAQSGVHYDWGGYDQALYKYYRDPATSEAYASKLDDAIRRGEAAGKLAPGLHAEYGYILMVNGRATDAVAQFEAEKQHWPESKMLMDRMIRLASTGEKSSAPNASRPQELTQ